MSCVVVLVGAHCSNRTCTAWSDLFLHNCCSDDRSPCQSAPCVVCYQPGYMDASLSTVHSLYFDTACCCTDSSAQKGTEKGKEKYISNYCKSLLFSVQYI